MSDQTFEQLWKRLLVHIPGLPRPLAEEFINEAYSNALSYTDWSRLRGNGDFIIPDAYTTGTISTTQNSTTVTGAATGWTSALVGRQLIIGGGGPYYTITDVGGLTTLTLDRPFADADQTNVAYQIVLALVEVPDDFIGFWTVWDPTNNWQLNRGMTSEDIDRFDAKRTSTGTPWVVAGTTPAADGSRRFELWPRPTTARYYPYVYERRPALMSAASDRPIYPLRGDILRDGALALVCLWPGTADVPNPLWLQGNSRIMEIYEARFKDGLKQASREDQELAQTMISYNRWRDAPFAPPIDAKFWQSHGGVI
jgi:hypothetical protein